MIFLLFNNKKKMLQVLEVPIGTHRNEHFIIRAYIKTKGGGHKDRALIKIFIIKLICV